MVEKEDTFVKKMPDLKKIECFFENKNDILSVKSEIGSLMN